MSHAFEKKVSVSGKVFDLKPLACYRRKGNAFSETEFQNKRMNYATV